MQISPINNNNQTFGHSFRVSICTRGDDGVVKFINPSENNKLYKQLNSKIVGWLNEEYYNNLRQLYGIPRKVEKTKPETLKHKEMSAKLREIDDDYAKFNVVRSVYRKNKLGLIATGADVSIIENLKGAKQIGLAKSDSLWTQGDSHNEYVKALSKAVKNNVIDFVEHDNVLLHSPSNKEIMLKAIFKPLGKKSGVERFELDDFEFHENYSKRTLAPVNPNFIRFKQSQGMLEEIKKTIQYHLNSILKRRVHFNDINSVLYPKIETPQAVEKAVQKSEPKPTFRHKEPKQLELKFKD